MFEFIVLSFIGLNTLDWIIKFLLGRKENIKMFCQNEIVNLTAQLENMMEGTYTVAVSGEIYHEVRLDDGTYVGTNNVTEEVRRLERFIAEEKARLHKLNNELF